jgi:antitoxin HigA-1
MTRVRNHPGKLLSAQLTKSGMSANQLALALHVPDNRVTAILSGERSIDAATAVRLGLYLGTGALFWIKQQAAFDISLVEALPGREFARPVEVY